MRHREQERYGPEGDQKTSSRDSSKDAGYLSQTFHTTGLTAQGSCQKKGAVPALLTMKKFAC
jgi:hypothetical protein